MYFNIVLILSISYIISTDPEYKDKYTLAIKLINNTIQNNTLFKNQAYQKAAKLNDNFSPRTLGSENLNEAIEYLKKEMVKDGFENISMEESKNISNWKRGIEILNLISPRQIKTEIKITGLVGSINGNVTTDIIVVNNEKDLINTKSLVPGKIVLLIDYSDISSALQIAIDYGAVGCLLKSQFKSLVTSSIKYSTDLKIPVAVISKSDSEMFERMFIRKDKIIVNLYMDSYYDFDSSFNLLGEIKGSTSPEQIVLVVGPLDSYDNGPEAGASEASGLMITYESIRTLIKLGLRPRRTIRFVALSGNTDNNGIYSYIKSHQKEIEKHVIAFQSNNGYSNLIGFGFSGGDNGFMIIRKTKELFLEESLGICNLYMNDGLMRDTEPLNTIYKIPVVRNLINNEMNYVGNFEDSVSLYKAEWMDKNVIGFSSLIYLISDFPVPLTHY